MSNNRGFTLTEILLAAMIVGLIGIALAAVTTAVLRESSVGRTRIILRDQLSLALHQLQQDIQEASAITIANDGRKLTLDFTDGDRPGPDASGRTRVVYELKTSGAVEALPIGSATSTIGNTIERTVTGGAAAGTEVWLKNVKRIDSYGYPSFQKLTDAVQDSRIQVKLIVQVGGDKTSGSPAINEAVVAVFTGRHGFGSIDPCDPDSEGSCDDVFETNS